MHLRQPGDVLLDHLRLRAGIPQLQLDDEVAVARRTHDVLDR
jgi:hypothetical protein